jgi:hypothetical protein
MTALNGRLPASQLATIPGTNRRLLAALVPQTAALRAAFQGAFGKPLVITDAYRSYAEQVTLKATKGVYAATPGTSNHGWGRAIDFGSGVNIEGSPEYRWMKAHAPTYGWTHPRWAEDGNPANGQQEPWHWEAAPTPVSSTAWSGATVPTTPGVTAPTPIEEDDMYTDADRARDEATYNWLREMHPPVVTAVPQIKAQMDALNPADTRTRIGNLQYAVGLLLARDPKTVTATDIAAAIPADLAKAVADELAKRLAG